MIEKDIVISSNMALTWNGEESVMEWGVFIGKEVFVCCWYREKLFTGSTAPNWKLRGGVKTNQLYGWDWIG